MGNKLLLLLLLLGPFISVLQLHLCEIMKNSAIVRRDIYFLIKRQTKSLIFFKDFIYCNIFSKGSFFSHFKCHDKVIINFREKIIMKLVIVLKWKRREKFNFRFRKYTKKKNLKFSMKNISFYVLFWGKGKLSHIQIVHISTF